jgi:hypothetical protein
MKLFFNPISLLIYCIAAWFIIVFGQYGLTAEVIKTYKNKKYLIEYPTPICSSCFDSVFDRTANELCIPNGYAILKKNAFSRSSWIIACRDSWGWYTKELRE